MKRKEVDDVMGGKDAWANVDRTDGMLHSSPGPAEMRLDEHRSFGHLSNAMLMLGFI